MITPLQSYVELKLDHMTLSSLLFCGMPLIAKMSSIHDAVVYSET